MESDRDSWYRPPPGSARRRFLKVALAVGGAAAASVLLGRALLSRGGEGGATPPDGGENPLDAFNDHIVRGGPGKDGIPSIDAPVFLSREEADEFLRPTNVVFGIEVDGDVRAYPQRILVWHEICNDVFGDRRIAVTYCPLTGSQIAFEGRASDGSPQTFGTTGNLVNSNLLMYDRKTDSDWPQILATAINGSQRGSTLTEVPLVWTSWERWAALHPETRVLGPDTGYFRDYSRDPYGGYDPDPAGYYASEGIWFPTMRRSDRFLGKRVVFGTKVGDHRLAIPLKEFRSVGVDNVGVGGVPLTILYDGRADTLRVFRRRVEGQSLTFALRDGEVRDAQTDSRWSVEGVAVDGPFAGTALSQVNAFNVMWFAWYAFYPDTLVWG